MRYQEIITEVLEHGRDDWVDFAEVIWIVLSHTKSQDRVASLPLCLEVIREMLDDDLIVAGDLVNQGGGIVFSEWPGNSDTTMDRIKRELNALGRNPGVGDVCWLLNTNKGDSAK